MKILVDVEKIPLQLNNQQWTTPAYVNLDKSGISIDVLVSDGQIGVEVALLEDGKIRMVIRNYTASKEPTPQVFDLYDLNKWPADAGEGER
jgi:hypothetical protein